MNLVNQQLILYPMFAMALLVFVSVFRLGYLRFSAMKKGEMRLSYYRTYRGGEEPEKLRAASRHLVNLFEMPVLFYLVTLLFYLTQQMTVIALALAWLYVIFRYLHSAVHLGANDVRKRFRLYFASVLVLLVLWLLLFVQLMMR